jgi:hypothetical protein
MVSPTRSFAGQTHNMLSMVARVGETARKSTPDAFAGAGNEKCPFSHGVSFFRW